MPSQDPTISEDKPHHLGHRQRLKERFIAGPEALPDYEILELLLFYAIPQKDTKPLAKALIARFGSIAGVLAAEPHQLMEFDGIKDNAATLLKAVRQAGILAAREQVADSRRTVLSSWDALLDYCRARFAGLAHEQFHLLFLDRKNVLIADETQQKGTIDHTPVYPREVVKHALALEASAIIMVPRHPTASRRPDRVVRQASRPVLAASRGPVPRRLRSRRDARPAKPARQWRRVIAVARKPPWNPRAARPPWAPSVAERRATARKPHPHPPPGRNA